MICHRGGGVWADQAVDQGQVFETMVHDLCELLRLAERHSAAILDSRTLQDTPESAGYAGHDGTKKKKGSKVHLPRGHPQ